MPTAFKPKSFRAMLLLGCVLTVWGAVGSEFASAQGLDMDASSNPPALAGQAGGKLDMDAAPTAPLPERPAASMLSQNQVQNGSAPLKPKMAPNVGFAPADQAPAAAASSLLPAAPPPATPMPSARSISVPSNAPGSTTFPTLLESTQSAGVAPSVIAEPIKLDRPTVVDTARLRAGETTISLYGIEGQAGEPAQRLQGYLNAADRQLTCQAQPTAGFVCLLPDGTDLAQVALINGAAQTMPDAPDAYKEQEAAAQAARRGIWVNLPPPPETLIHPTVPDTATITGNGRTYPLDGVVGLGHPYADEMQGYVAAAGDSLTCSMQQAAGTYICLLPNGIDIAKVALVNGAARVAADAPDSYRVQQADALTNHRGLWAVSPPDAVPTVVEPDQYAFIAGDDGIDGVTYIGGAPTALIDGEEVFLVLGAGALGWGYYDHWHHWHGAPDRYRAHLDRFHPDGRGLRGYRTEAALHRDGGFHREEGLHREPGFQREAGVHPSGMVPHPAMPGERPEVVSHAPMGAPGGRPGGFAGGGLVRPAAAASAGGFHPAAPAARVPAPGKHR